MQNSVIHSWFQAPAGASNSTQNETGEIKPLLTSKMVSLPQYTGERSQRTELGRRKLASEINQARTQHTDNGNENESQNGGGVL